MEFNKDICSEIWKHLDDIKYCFVSKTFNDGFKQAIKLGQVTLKCKGEMFSKNKLKYLCNAGSIDFRQYCENITDEVLEYVQKAHKINLSGCYKITDEGLRHLKNVQILTLFNNNLTGKGYKYLQNVRMIDLSNNNITADELEFFQKVETINLSNCFKISNNGLRHLRNVKNIDISGCIMITDEGLQHLQCVEKIIISNCPFITQKGLKIFEKKTVVYKKFGGFKVSLYKN